MDNLPLGVEAFDHNTAVVSAKSNVILAVFGESKSGKTHFAVRCQRPLYIAYLDPNTNLDYHLLNAEKQYPGDVYKLVIPPIRYEDLSKYEAQTRVDRVEEFAKWARAEAEQAVEAGKPAGTFVIDGCTLLKGYLEKALLGESTTLGWRPAKGETGGPNRFAYAQSNAYIRDIVSGFVHSKLDVVLVWEGRPVYSNGELTSRYKSTMPLQVPFAVNAQVETLVALEPIVENGVRVGMQAVPELRIGWNAYSMDLQDRRMPAVDFATLKDIFLADVPGVVAAEMLRPAGEEVIRANLGSILESGEE